MNSSLNILVCLADLVSEAAPWSVHSCGDINPEGVNLHLSSGPALPVWVGKWGGASAPR